MTANHAMAICENSGDMIIIHDGGANFPIKGMPYLLRIYSSGVPKYPRIIFGTGVLKYGEVIFSMTPVMPLDPISRAGAKLKRSWARD